MKGRNKFECGHRGFGSYCHRCKLSEAMLEKSKKLRNGSERQATMVFEAIRLKTVGPLPDQSHLHPQLVQAGLEPDDAWRVIHQNDTGERPTATPFEPQEQSEETPAEAG